MIRLFDYLSGIFSFVHQPPAMGVFFCLFLGLLYIKNNLGYNSDEANGRSPENRPALHQEECVV